MNQETDERWRVATMTRIELEFGRKIGPEEMKDIVIDEDLHAYRLAGRLAFEAIAHGRMWREHSDER